MMVVATGTRQRGLIHTKLIDLPVPLEHFEIHNRTEGKSPRCVESYNLVLGQLCDWLEKRDTPATLDPPLLLDEHAPTIWTIPSVYK